MEPTEIALLVGRILLGAYLIYAGIGHLLGRRMMAPYAQSKGVPAPMLAVVGTGVLLLGAGSSILFGIYPLIGLGAAALFLLGVTPVMHNFWTIEDPMQRMGEQINFAKNLGLLGAILALFAVATPWAYTVL